MKNIRKEKRGSKSKPKSRKKIKMHRTRKARNLHKPQEFDAEGKVKRFHSKKKYSTGKSRWVHKEVKRLEKVAKAKREGVKLKRRTFKSK